MRKIVTLEEREVEPSSIGECPLNVEGKGECRCLSPPEFPLWMYSLEFQSAGVIQDTWNKAGEAVYVAFGEIRIGSATCGPGGAVILEPNWNGRIDVATGTHLLRWGSRVATDGEPPQGARAHVVGPRGWFEHNTPRGSGVVWYTDGTCPACDAVLLKVRRGKGPADRGEAHTHSADEIVYVLGGEIRMGAHRYRAGSSICIPADVRYAFAKSPDGFEFLNFRAALSWQTVYPGPGADPITSEESALARGGVFVGDVRDVTPDTRPSHPSARH